MADPLFVPAGFAVPGGLVARSLRLEPLGPQHNDEDHEAWTSSIEHIRGTPGFHGRSWPVDGMTLEENLADLRRHADDFAARTGFTYTVIDGSAGRVVGCVYIYPGRHEGQQGYDADVRSWVRADRAELDEPVYEAVTAWLATAWPFVRAEYASRRR
ncbi:MAG: hypothetical protein JWO67_5010 [Streptosporangiaceae bacterium]|jgi:hypothetical protein|nr:hypothetical protein [Streptosporangiaceae bacterium]